MLTAKLTQEEYEILQTRLMQAEFMLKLDPITKLGSHNELMKLVKELLDSFEEEGLFPKHPGLGRMHDDD
jgi:hypothetical protein